MSALPEHFKLPLYAKAALVLIAAYAFIYFLIIGQEIIAPLLFATIIAILLNSLVVAFERLRLPRTIAITLSVATGVVFVIGFAFFLTSQIAQFSAALPQLEAKLNLFIVQLSAWLGTEFHVTPETIAQWKADMGNFLFSNSGVLIGRTLTTITGILFVITLLPVYVWLILYYQPLLLEFLRKLFGRTHQEAVGEVLVDARGIIQSYLIGLLIEVAIVSSLATISLLILDIDYAFLLGIIAGLFNMIPYIGGIVGVALPMSIALLTKDDPFQAIWVLAAYLVIQFIDNNIVVPRIVAAKVKVNALISVIVVIIGGALWGIPGMFLSIPMTAIIKVICDRFEPLKPYGFLLGDTMPRHSWYSLEYIRQRAQRKANRAR
jgi:predicted PurR-regulated permease PerM